MKQNAYLVTWEIDIWADNPQEAAHKAWAIQKDPGSIANVFKVFDDKGGEPVIVDLQKILEEKEDDCKEFNRYLVSIMRQRAETY